MQDPDGLIGVSVRIVTGDVFEFRTSPAATVGELREQVYAKEAEIGLKPRSKKWIPKWKFVAIVNGAEHILDDESRLGTYFITDGSRLRVSGYEKVEIQPGDNELPVAEDANEDIIVHATGWGKDGSITEKFWSTKDEGEEPFRVQLGKNQVIRGMARNSSVLTPRYLFVSPFSCSVGRRANGHASRGESPLHLQSRVVLRRQRVLCVGHPAEFESDVGTGGNGNWR
jgi:hypothetical protein